MNKSPLDYLGIFAVFSLFLIEVAIAYPLYISNEIASVTGILDNRTVLVIAVCLIGIDIIIHILLNEFYEPITAFLFKRQMLEFTYAKKIFENGYYEVEGKPLKSYDKLPSDIKNSIDKLDSLYYNQKMPHLFDLTVGFANSSTFLLLGILQNNNNYSLIGTLMSIFFGLLLARSYFAIGKMILIDYKSIFEE